MSTELPPPAYADLNTASPLEVALAADSHTGEVLITLTPPTAPLPGPDEKHPQTRAPIDICCVIDISGSMSAEAPIPGENSEEKTGLSVLDVVKHAVRTIVASLGPEDRISLVSFESQAQVVSYLTHMDEKGKSSTLTAVEGLRTAGGTNLWEGLKLGMNVLTGDKKPSPKSKVASSSKPEEKPKAKPQQPAFSLLSIFGGKGKAPEPAPTEKPKPPPTLTNPTIGAQRVSSIFLLTDGCPTVIPPRGHLPMLNEYLKAHPQRTFTISTFGFGYSLDSGLLTDIAAAGGGTYAFIPDAGLVGTVFINAGANLCATYASACTLDVRVDVPGPAPPIQVLGVSQSSDKEISIDIGAVQYGQTRDVVISLKGASNGQVTITATARLRPWSLPPSANPLSTSTKVEFTLFQDGPPDPRADDLKYHASRLRFVRLVASTELGTRPLYGGVVNTSGELRKLSHIIRATLPEHAAAQALAEDIEGQALLALLDEHFNRWGRHYLPSLARAHLLQQCVNFKDPGLQVYGANSPLFTRMRAEIDAAFDALPPPKPSIRPHPSSGVKYKAISSMSAYNYSSGPCFAGYCRVGLASGANVRMDELRRGMMVKTPAGVRRVAAVVRTRIPGGLAALCQIGELGVTPWHPICVEGTWCFPADLVKPAEVACDAVFSVLLEHDSQTEAHAVVIEGVVCVTLGHGVLGKSDVRSHAFLGDYERVVGSLRMLPGFTGQGVVETGGVVRSSTTGLIKGFAAPCEGDGEVRPIECSQIQVLA